jgi:inosose dehydratase
MADDLKLATGPVTWGVDFADAPGNPPWRLVLDEIQRSALGALELGPVGYLPEDPAILRQALGARDLIAVGSFVFEAFHDPSQGAAIAAVTVRACRAIAAAGGSLLVIIDRPGAARAATAGRSSAAVRLDTSAWQGMLAGFEAAAAVARDHGLTPVIHPHAGTFVEFEDEIERLLDSTDLDICFDSGHLAYAGIAPEQAVRAYAGRIGHVHLKDVRAETLDRVRKEKLGFWAAIQQGVFCPLGDGVVRLPVLLGALAGTGYTDFMTIERDRVAGDGSPLEELARSIDAVRSAARGSEQGVRV